MDGPASDSILWRIISTIAAQRCMVTIVRGRTRVDGPEHRSQSVGVADVSVRPPVGRAPRIGVLEAVVLGARCVRSCREL
eukprot:4843287-Prymnesium_polylepis.2